MLLVLVGPICSGKTTFARYLEDKHGFNRIVTYTTRSPRLGEVDGVDYNFISEERFEEIIEDDEFLEYMEYNATFGHCYYGSKISEEDLQGKKVIVLNPDGATALRDSFQAKDFFIVYLECPEWACLTRAQKRGDDLQEVTRRLKEDEINSFDKFRHNHIFDLVIWGAPNVETIYSYIKDRLGDAI